MILFIDTTDYKSMHFALVGIQTREQRFEIAHNQSWQTLDYLEKFLKKKGVVIADVEKIIVCSGPGSFTGTRVGVTIAQGIAFARQIPIVAIEKNKVPSDLVELASLKDGKKINITYTQSKFD